MKKTNPRIKTAHSRPVVLLWGGTGGHIFPLVALKKTLSLHDFWPFYWIGEKDSLEERIAQAEEIPFFAIKSGKFRRYFSWRTFVEPINIIKGFFQSYSVLRNLRPALVFSKGGYVSLPAAMAAKILDIPVFLQESDSIPGLSNRAVSRFSETVFLGFPEAVEYFPNVRCVVSGQLLDPTINWWNGRKTNERSRVLAIGGSLGSSRVFSAVRSAAKSLPETVFEIVLGKLNSGMRSKFEGLVNVECHDFLSQKEMAEAYARADLVITRAGATSLAEIEASWAGMIIVPLEGSANDHQWANARAYTERGYPILSEGELDTLPSLISQMLSVGWKTVSTIPHITGTEVVAKEIIKRFSKK